MARRGSPRRPQHQPEEPLSWVGVEELATKLTERRTDNHCERHRVRWTSCRPRGRDAYAPRLSRRVAAAAIQAAGAVRPLITSHRLTNIRHSLAGRVSRRHRFGLRRVDCMLVDEITEDCVIDRRSWTGAASSTPASTTASEDSCGARLKGRWSNRYSCSARVHPTDESTADG